MVKLNRLIPRTNISTKQSITDTEAYKLINKQLCITILDLKQNYASLPSIRSMIETLCAASEEDLRKAGLRMGDIIKIRKLLANRNVSNQSKDLDNSFSSTSESDTSSLADKTTSPMVAKKVRFSPVNFHVVFYVRFHPVFRWIFTLRRLATVFWPWSVFFEVKISHRR